MSRAPKTRESRAADVVAAAAQLRTAVGRAVAAERDHGADAPETIAAWETVEQHGATVHRQARLLAGKTRGG